MKIIKNRELVDDQWQLVDGEDNLPAGDVIVPFGRWKNESEQLQNHSGKVGVVLNGDDNLEEAIDHLHHFDVVALSFPKYTDGRSFSFARLLRDRYKYQGELRAIGNILRDQLAFLERCGFDAFVLGDEDPEESLQSFDDVSVKYQSAADKAEPVYRYR